jgi:hypothetical protein
MYANRRHYQNVVPVTRFIIGIAIVGFITSASIFFVWSRNQIDAQGRQLKELERESARLQNEFEVVRSEIARRSSTGTLQQGFKNGLIQLVAINGRFEPIYRIETPDGNEVRAVSNPNRSRRP